MAKKSNCSLVKSYYRPKNCDRAIVIQKMMRGKAARSMVRKKKASGSSSNRKRKSPGGKSPSGRPKRSKKSPKRLIASM